jgi:hypothetical protein
MRTRNWTVAAIQSLRPGAEFALTGDRLDWQDQTQSQPTAEEIAAEAARLQAAEPLRLAKERRAADYKREADPLFFKAQRGEIAEQEWIDKVSEIRARHPYPQP